MGRRVSELWRILRGSEGVCLGLVKSPKGVGGFAWGFGGAPGRLEGPGWCPGGAISPCRLKSECGGLLVYWDLGGCRLFGVLEPSGFFILSSCLLLLALFLRRLPSNLSSSLSRRSVAFSIADTWEGVESG